MNNFKKPLRLEDFEIYELAMDVGEDIWQIVESWEFINKKHPGLQITKAVDSIAANIAEGHGRYFYKEKRLFYFYARGSLLETKTWISKCHNRKLIIEEKSNNLISKLGILHFKLNNYLITLKEK